MKPFITLRAKINFHLVTFIALVHSPAVLAQEVRGQMNSLLTPFKAIQPYIASEELFLDEENSEDIFDIIQGLRKSFHKIETLPTKYHNLPGFDENTKSVAELLDDASRRFSEGKKSYAWWRLRKLPSDCFTCHATYKVDSRYSNPGVIDESLDPLNKARFLLATRQFAAAESEFLQVLKDPGYRLYYDEALRSILMITTRISRNPAEGAKILSSIADSAMLPEDDARSARAWASELNAWSKDKRPVPKNSLAEAERLIKIGLNESPDTNQNDVALLRGTALLHKELEDGKLNKTDRARALYLLGFAYTKLPLFFSESWAEMYLERCISEFPGTKTAKQAYAVYRGQIIDDYTGTAGTEIPDEIKLHLEELRKKAHDEGNFTPIVKAASTSQRDS
jgi:hypothetical protein